MNYLEDGQHNNKAHVQKIYEKKYIIVIEKKRHFRLTLRVTSASRWQHEKNDLLKQNKCLPCKDKNNITFLSMAGIQGDPCYTNTMMSMAKTIIFTMKSNNSNDNNTNIADNIAENPRK